MKHFVTMVISLFCFCAFSQQVQKNGDIEGFKLYPNPTLNGKVFIDTELNTLKQIHIFDVLGTQVLQTTISDNELNLTNLNRGVYIVRVIENNRVATRKLVLK